MILEDLISEMKNSKVPAGERELSDTQEVDCVSKNGIEIRHVLCDTMSIVRIMI